VVPAAPGGQRAGVAPAPAPGEPARGDALRRPLLAGGRRCGRGGHDAEGHQDARDGRERRPRLLAQGRGGPDDGQRLRADGLERGVAGDEEERSERGGHRPRRPVGAVAPRPQLALDPPAGRGQRVRAEDARGEMPQPDRVPAGQGDERQFGLLAQQVGERQGDGAGARAVGIALAGGEDRTPLGPPPGPVGALLALHLAQDRAHGGRRGGGGEAGRRQRRPQRPDEPRERAVGRAEGVGIAGRRAAPRGHLRQCRPLGRGQHRRAVVAGEVDGRGPGRRHRRWAGGAHASTSASCAARQAWTCAMPWASFAPSSRPLRWM